MLRMYLLERWFNLSHEAVEDSVCGSYAMRKSMELKFLEEQAPDAIRQCLEENGHLTHGGSLVDATILANGCVPGPPGSG